MRVLVVGAREVDAGKTTFTRGLIAVTGANAYKPRAANDLWYHRDAYLRAIEAGSLYGKDAWLLAKAQSAEVTPQSINVIHRLWQPIADQSGGIHARAYRQFLVDRVGEQYVVNANAELPEELEQALPLDEATTVDSLDSVNRIVEQEYLPAIGRWEQAVSKQERLLVESYRDIATPALTLEFDIVAAVEPGRVRYYDGTRYRKACSTAPSTSREGRMEPTVGGVVRDLEPLDQVEIPPLPSDRRATSETIARAYRDAYERLLDLTDTRTLV